MPPALSIRPNCRDQRLALVVQRVRRHRAATALERDSDRSQATAPSSGIARCGPCRCAGSPDRRTRRLRLKRLPRMSAFWSSSRYAGVPGVLGELLAGKRGHPVVALGHVRLQVETLLEARDAVAEVSLASGKLPDLRVEFRRIGVPRGGRRIDFGEIPAVGRRIGQSGRGRDRSRANQYEATSHFGDESGRWRGDEIVPSRNAGSVKYRPYATPKRIWS